MVDRAKRPLILDHDTGEEASKRRVSPFVVAGTTELQLSDGEWIEVKEQLSFGEQEDLNTAGLKTMKTVAGETEVSLEWSQFNTAKILMWVVDWSFRLPNGHKADINMKTVRNLRDDVAKEILLAIENYQTTVAEKNSQAPALSELTETSA